jgi:ABC-type antimicrobial peptide transport system permease subunit
VRTFAALYLTVGFLAGLFLFSWVAVASVRRHGFRNAMRGAARTYAEELSTYWRVPVAAWTVLIGLPLVAAWALTAASGILSARSASHCSG